MTTTDHAQEAVETCRLCTNPELLLPGEDIPLCRRHWSAWLTRFLGDEEAPCAAHLIVSTIRLGLDGGAES